MVLAEAYNMVLVETLEPAVAAVVDSAVLVAVAVGRDNRGNTLEAVVVGNTSFVSRTYTTSTF